MLMQNDIKSCQLKYDLFNFYIAENEISKNENVNM